MSAHRVEVDGYSFEMPTRSTHEFSLKVTLDVRNPRRAVTILSGLCVALAVAVIVLAVTR